MGSGQVVGSSSFAGAWRRLGAFLVDGFLLGLVGIAAGFALFDFFVRMGGWGRLVGFAIALAYFSTLNSRIGHGQTLGKRMLKIRVVGADGSALPFSKAVLRFAVLGTPWFLNNAWFSREVMTSPLTYLLSAIIFGLGVAIVYLFLFNRPTRQSLHDLAVSSYVVPSESVESIAGPPPRRVHVVVASGLVLAAAAAPIFTTRLSEAEPFAALMKAYRAIDAEPGVVLTSIDKGWSSTSAGKTTYLAVVAYLDEPRIDDEVKASRLAKLALEADPSAMNVDVVQVSLVYGYDIGIASGQRSMPHRNTPAGWMTGTEVTH